MDTQDASVLRVLYIIPYLPYQCVDNYAVFVEYIGKLSALIDEVSTSNLILLGDFNAADNTVHLCQQCSSRSFLARSYCL